MNLCLCDAEFALKKTLAFESISVEAFTFGNDQYVVHSQPFSGKCSFMEWDHVNMEFRAYDTIESEHHISQSALVWIPIAEPQKLVKKVHLMQRLIDWIDF